MVLTRLTAAEPLTAGRLELVVDLSPDDTVGALETALTGLPPSAKTQLWIGERELQRDITVHEAGVTDGVVVSVGGPARDLPLTPGGAELRVLSGPDAGAVHPLPAGKTVLGGPGSDIALTGLATDRMLLSNGPSGVVATSLDPEQPVRRAGVPLQLTIALSAGDFVEVGPHLLSVDVSPTAPVRATGDLPRVARQQADLEQHVLEPPLRPAGQPEPTFALVPGLATLALGLLLGFTASRLFLLLAVAAPFVVYTLRWRDQRAAARLQQQELVDFNRAVAEFAADQARLLSSELSALREAAPDPVSLLRVAAHQDAVLWHRGPADEDRLLLRVGTSTRSATTWRVGDQEPVTLHDVPVTLPLRRAGVLGFAGDVAAGRALARWMVAQAALRFAPQDLSIWLLTSPNADSQASGEGVVRSWDWLRWLPHTRSQPDIAANLVGNTEESVSARISELTALLAERRALASPAPDVLVILDGTVREWPALAELLRDGPSLGVFALCVGLPAAPRHCRSVLTLDPQGRLTVSGTGAVPVGDVRADLVSSEWAEQVGRALAPLGSLGAGTPGPSPLPRHLSLLELDTLDGSQQRWQVADSVPLGITAAGPLLLELSANCLIAGADHDVASALLHTTVVSLARHRSPEVLNLLLLGDLGELSALPQVSSSSTLLSGSQAARAMASLQAESRRRESLLASVSAPDVVAFAAHGALPRLVLVIDEIADLASQRPQFVTQLATLLEGSARLGIHLIASTSRPSAVPRELLAVLAQRLVLRLDSRADSERLLGSPVATSVLHSRPGRGYARVGSGALTPFQAADLTSRQAPARTGLHAEELTWERLGMPMVSEQKREPALPAVLTELMAQGSRAGPSPWLPPLPDRVQLEELGADLSSGSLRYGLADLPAEQQQRPTAWDVEREGHLLVVGAPRSGRSTLLLTLAASLAHTTSSSDAHLYAIDCGNGSLADVGLLPHCGAVVSADEQDRVDRLLTRLATEVGRRRRQLADRGFIDLAAQRKGTADPLPYLLLLIDGWEGFVRSLGRLGDGRLTETLVELVRDGGPAGLRIALTGDRSLLTADVAALVPERLVLRLDDEADYALAGLDPASVPAEVPPGRAFRARLDHTDAAIDSVQIALLTGDLGELAANLPTARGRKPFRVDPLPERLSWRDAQRLAPSGPGVALAVGGDELRLQTVNLLTCGPGFTVAGAPGSGRSTALVVLARSLLEAGIKVCLLTPAPSPLRELRGAPDVLAGGDRPDLAELTQAMEQAQGPVVVLVDDADQLDDPDLGQWLQNVLRHARAHDHALVVAGDTSQLAASTTGLAFDARRSRSGLLLTPSSIEEGDLLGVRLPRSAVFSEPIGRGLLVRSGQVQLVQVPLPLD